MSHHACVAVAVFEKQLKCGSTLPKDSKRVSLYASLLVAFFAVVLDYIDVLQADLQQRLSITLDLARQVRSWVASHVGAQVSGQEVPVGVTFDEERFEQFVSALREELEDSVDPIVSWIIDQTCNKGLSHQMAVTSVEAFGKQVPCGEADGRIVNLLISFSLTVQASVVNAQTQQAMNDLRRQQ